MLGVRAMSKGFLNFRFGNARTTLNGGGGSGEPTMREVVQGARTAGAGPVCCAGGDCAADGTRQFRNPPTRNSVNANTARRHPPRKGDPMISTPEGTARMIQPRAAPCKL